MKIIVSHAYSNDNKGDAALLSVLLNDIRQTFQHPVITILTLDKVKENETFEDSPIRNSFIYYVSDYYKNPFLKAIHALFVATSTLFWALIYRYTGKSLPLPKYLKDIVLLYKDADLIIPVGGGYIRGKSGFRDTVILFFIIHPLLFTYILRKPTINYTQSIGPFGNKLQEYLARFALKRVTGIIVREKISLELLKKWNITKNIFLSVDAGFFFTSKDTRDMHIELGISQGKMLVGITVRNWLETEAQIHYEKTIAKLCDYIIKKYDAIIVFLPQVTVENHRDDDRENAKKVHTFMDYKDSAHVVYERYDHYAIKALYAKLDYLIGTRFHSVIFGLTSYIPSIAIGYEHKTMGIMIDLGLEKWVMDIQKIEVDQLIILFDDLIINRDVYINHLKKILPSYIKGGRESIYFIKKLYETTL